MADDLRHEIESRMLSGEPFTYGDLCTQYRNDKRADPGVDRLIDRTIQRLRKGRKIDWSRKAGRIVWFLVADPRVA